MLIPYDAEDQADCGARFARRVMADFLCAIRFSSHEARRARNLKAALLRRAVDAARKQGGRAVPWAAVKRQHRLVS